jgi:hypothetical protein
MNLFSARVNVHKLNTNKETKSKLVIVEGVVLFVTKEKIGGSYCLFSPFGIEHISQYQLSSQGTSFSAFQVDSQTEVELCRSAIIFECDVTPLLLLFLQNQMRLNHDLQIMITAKNEFDLRVKNVAQAQTINFREIEKALKKEKDR